ncbi:hypothetical protein LIL_13137 [Leptospira interrogans serovar Linhai str. 56609]|nr:hypothetical protein LIL_13137 [Leptospira interrogans serovar Linhai str. 56609]
MSVMMWELLQITILRTNSKIVGIHTFRKPDSHYINRRIFCIQTGFYDKIAVFYYITPRIIWKSLF